MPIHESIARLKSDMLAEGIEPEKGLGQELFLFASTLMPIVNVDLLVLNDKGEFLLSWRDDAHCGRGWHVPGGCIRLGETFSERIQQTAMAELGTKILYCARPVGAFDFFIREYRDGIVDQRERSHSVGLLYVCRLPKGYELPVYYMDDLHSGVLRWFTELPDDLLKVHDRYREDWNNTYKAAWRDYNGILEK